MKTLLVLSLALALTWPALPAAAGKITLQTSTTCTVTEQGVRVEVAAANLSRESAANLQVLVSCRGTERASPVRPVLRPGQTWTARLDLEPRLTRPGAYPVVVRVDFQDLNGYPFSALSWSSFAFQEGVTAEVFIPPARTRLSGQGRLSLQVQNKDARPHQVRVRLVVPRELTVSPPEKRVDLPAGGERAVDFRLKNRTARDGSTYPALAILEYEAGGRHYSAVSEAKVRVVVAKNFFKRHRRALALLGALLGLAAVLLHFRPGPDGSAQG